MDSGFSFLNQFQENEVILDRNLDLKDVRWPFRHYDKMTPLEKEKAENTLKEMLDWEKERGYYYDELKEKYDRARIKQDAFEFNEPQVESQKPENEIQSYLTGPPKLIGDQVLVERLAMSKFSSVGSKFL